MAVTIGTGTLLQGGNVITTSGGNIYIIKGAGDFLYFYKSTDGGATFSGYTSVSSVNIFGQAASVYVSAAIDGAGYIHVVCASTPSTSATRDVAYATLNTSDDSWSSWEQAANYTDNVGSGAGVSIAIDSNNKPHVLYINTVTSMGNDYTRVYYTNKVSGSWLTPEMVSTGTTTNYYALRMTVRNSDIVEAVYIEGAGSSGVYRVRNGTWGTETSYDASIGYIDQGNVNVLAKSDGTVYRYLHVATVPYDEYENDADTGANVYQSGWGWVCLVSSTRYVIFPDHTDRDVKYVKNDGSGWTAEATLETGTFTRVICEWAYNYEYQSNRINYIFDDGANLYFNYLSLGSNPSVSDTAAATDSCAIAISPIPNVTDTAGANATAEVWTDRIYLTAFDQAGATDLAPALRYSLPVQVQDGLAASDVGEFLAEGEAEPDREIAVSDAAMASDLSCGSYILYIDHETGDLSQWDSFTPDQTQFAASSDSALAGTNFGLAVTMPADTTNRYADKNITSSNNGRLRFRFYFDPNSFASSVADAFNIITLYTSSATFVTMRANLTGGNYQLQLQVYDNLSGTHATAYHNISDEPHWIEIDMVRSESGLSNGSAEFWVDGFSQEELTGIDNDTKWTGTASFHIGYYNRLATTTGTIFFDQLVANDDGHAIGAFVKTITLDLPISVVATDSAGTSDSPQLEIGIAVLPVPDEVQAIDTVELDGLEEEPKPEVTDQTSASDVPALLVSEPMAITEDTVQAADSFGVLLPFHPAIISEVASVSDEPQVRYSLPADAASGAEAADSVALALTLAIDRTDLVATSDEATGRVGDVQLEVEDTAGALDFVDLGSAIILPISDTVAEILEAVELRAGDLLLQTVTSAGVSDACVVSSLINTEVSDACSTSDQPDLAIELVLNVSDPASADDVGVASLLLCTEQVEEFAASDQPVAAIQLLASVLDLATASGTAELLLPLLTVDTSDQADALDEIVLHLPVLWLEVTDNAGTLDICDLGGAQPVSVDDIGSTADLVQLIVSEVILEVASEAAAEDNVSLYTEPNIRVMDAAATEDQPVLVQELAISIVDPVSSNDVSAVSYELELSIVDFLVAEDYLILQPDLSIVADGIASAQDTVEVAQETAENKPSVEDVASTTDFHRFYTDLAVASDFATAQMAWLREVHADEVAQAEDEVALRVSDLSLIAEDQAQADDQVLITPSYLAVVAASVTTTVDSSQLYIEIAIQAGEAAGVSDLVGVAVESPTSQVSDLAIVADTVSLLLPQLFLSVEEPVGVIDYPDLGGSAIVVVTDIAAAGDLISLVLSALSLTVRETASVVDSILGAVATPPATVTDILIGVDSVSLAVSLAIPAWDGVTSTDTGSAAIQAAGAWSVSTQDTASASDAASSLINPLHLAVVDVAIASDDPRLAYHINLAVTGILPVVTDTVAVSPEMAQPRAISVGDTAFVLEETLAFPAELFIEVADSAGLTEERFLAVYGGETEVAPVETVITEDAVWLALELVISADDCAAAVEHIRAQRRSVAWRHSHGFEVTLIREEEFTVER